MCAFGLRHLLQKPLKIIFFKQLTQAQNVIKCRNYGSKTIFALSSGSTKCAVAVLRVSGPKSSLALQQICGGLPKQRMASLRKLRDPLSKELLDKSIVIWFPGPQSYTGEDCAEFHVHGGPAVVNSVLNALSSIPGLCPAQPGDFTKQAFLNGKLDLTEVEGLGDLIHAETEAQRKQALRQMDGDLGVLYSGWRQRLLKCLANTEAFIDFHEEENIEDDILESVLSETTVVRDDILKHLNDSRCGERLREGLNLVIAGEPNVGKSSLLNSICQRPAAIVSPIAGTTRDIVETALNIAGYPVLLSDTAGLRETNDPIEREGVNRALDRMLSSDLKVLVVDATKQANILAGEIQLKHFVISYLEELSHFEKSLPSDDISNGDLSSIFVVLNKIDLVDSADFSEFLNRNGDHVSAISCMTGQGFDDFMEKLVKKIKNLSHDLLSRDVVLAAERLRLAVGEVGLITGAVSAEDILDVIFRDFCIGK